MNKKNLLMLAIPYLYFMTSCASDGPEDLEDNLTSKQLAAGQTIGVNKDGEVVVETQTTAAAELHVQELTNERLYENVRHETFRLEECRKDLADPQNGGSGEMGKTPDISDYMPKDHPDAQFGYDENGKLVWKSQVNYLDKLKGARDYQTTLQKVEKEVVRMRKECEYSLRVARNQKETDDE